MATLERELAGLTIGDVTVRQPVSVTPDITLGTFMDAIFLAHRHTAYPVMLGGRAVGLVSFRQAAEVPRSRWTTTTVSERMLRAEQALHLDRSTPLGTGLIELARAPLNRALVYDHDRFAGIASITDAVRVAEATRVQRNAQSRRDPSAD